MRVSDLEVLDLREPPALNRVGLELDDITDEDWTACQAVGQSADFLQYGGVIAPSATGVGRVLALFEARIVPGQLAVEHSEQLTEALYRELSR